MNEDRLDVITLGRSSVDLYGAEIGTRMEEVRTFKKSVGGCPANIAIGAARLGLKSAILTRVGNEPMGRFIVSEMRKEGVEINGIGVDDKRLTALVFLVVRDASSSPHIFYRENCADMALSEEDIDPDFIERTGCIVVTGTHFSSERVAAASWKAIRLAKQTGAKVVFDIDFRPSLWGLVPQSEGQARMVLSVHVRDTLRDVIAASDVVVGTEEEFCSALNTPDLSSALADVRKQTRAVIVCKKGAHGCEIYPNTSDRVLGTAVTGTGFSVDVVNTVGAGDAFLSGFLRGWLRGEDWQTTASWANACGAIAVARLLCSSEYPTWAELTVFIANHRTNSRAVTAANIAHVHWATTRRPLPEELFVLAVDHRWQFEEIADSVSVSRTRLSTFKRLAVSAAGLVSERHRNVGIICDGYYGAEALLDADALSLWVARSIEEPRSKPLRFTVGLDVGSALMTWPSNQTVKCLCHYDLDDPREVRERQEAELIRLNQACKALGREFLLEIIPSASPGGTGQAVQTAIRRLYDIGVRPDWWKLEPIKSQSDWAAIGEAISTGDRYCRGVLILGLTSSEEELHQAFEASSTCDVVKGFAVGRAIVGRTIAEWLSGHIDDNQARTEMATRFESVVEAWRSSRKTSIRGVVPPSSTDTERSR